MYNGFNLIENKIPQSRLLVIENSRGDVIHGYPLIIDDDISIKVSSNFGQLWEGKSNSLMSLLSSSMGLPSGQFALQGAQIWQSTDPITFSLTAHLEMDNDPYTDVVMNTAVLTSLALPSLADGTHTIAESTEKFVEKTLNIKIKTLIPPGPNLQTLFSSASGSGGDVDSKLLENPMSTTRGVYNVKLGFFKIPKVIVKSVEPTFSKTVSKRPIIGSTDVYPIRADLSIEFTTMEIATTNMISQIFNVAHSSIT